VRLRLGDRRHAERAAGAGPVLEHEGLPDLPRYVLEHRPAQGVERASRRERQDQADRLLLRPGLSQAWAPERDHEQRTGEGVAGSHVGPRDRRWISSASGYRRRWRWPGRRWCGRGASTGTGWRRRARAARWWCASTRTTAPRPASP